MEVIFNHQISHQRDIIGTIGLARRKWKYLYSWFPEEQRRLYSHMDRIYKEVQQKHNHDMFMEYAQERRLNKRIINEEQAENPDKDEFGKYPCLKPILDKYNHLPIFYYKTECVEPNRCQEKENGT